MTKTLTEQWKKKELKDGDYYVLNKAGDIVCDYYIEILGHFDSVLTENVKEVLAPVPSYEEYKRLVRKSDKLDKIMSDAVTNKGDCQQIVEDNLNRQIERLQKQLAIATKALNGIRDVWANNTSQFSFISRIANRKAKTALEEMEGVK